jgi:hypothetical protein
MTQPMAIRVFSDRPMPGNGWSELYDDLDAFWGDLGEGVAYQSDGGSVALTSYLFDSDGIAEAVTRLIAFLRERGVPEDTWVTAGPTGMPFDGKHYRFVCTDDEPLRWDVYRRDALDRLDGTANP